ncbi:unnamed protein product [Cylicocyclus nassatus]|uniref:C-type lectin domain-containing protein n=1 Tax=Cylicocyclus nassatus TaxID=53992 RepID=A0AA36GRD4_CYLNA|nr:unnamed protein product [Cylicocyclus nassatus]
MNKISAKVAETTTPWRIRPISSSTHPAHCDVGWAYYDETDSCYKNFFGLNFDDAERLCRTVGGHLTSIHTSTENSFVGELAKSGIAPEKCCELATWIGLTRPDIPNSNWTWTDGTEVDFLAWAPKQPDDFRGVERCTVLNSDAHANLTMALFFRKWEDAECSLTKLAFFWKNFDEAEGVCRTLGGHLTSIHSFLENDFVAELAKSGKPYTSCCFNTTWIDLRRDPVNNNWTWTDGTEVDILAWAPTEPNNGLGIQRCVSVSPLNRQRL